MDAVFFQSALQGHAVDDRGQHAHVIALNPVQPHVFGLHPAEDIAAADDHRYLDPGTHHGLDFLGILYQSIRVNAILLFAHQRLTA
jgi:hypothetical protein